MRDCRVNVKQRRELRRKRVNAGTFYKRRKQSEKNESAINFSKQEQDKVTSLTLGCVSEKQRSL